MPGHAPFFVLNQPGSRKFGTIQRKSRDSNENYCQSERNYCRSETNYHRGERNYCRGERNYCCGEKNYCRSERNYCRDETNVRLRETNVRLRETNVRLRETNVRLRETNYWLSYPNTSPFIIHHSSFGTALPHGRATDTAIHHSLFTNNHSTFTTQTLSRHLKTSSRRSGFC